MKRVTKLLYKRDIQLLLYILPFYGYSFYLWMFSIDFFKILIRSHGNTTFEAVQRFTSFTYAQIFQNMHFVHGYSFGYPWLSVVIRQH